jgi:hypothetical protein
MNSPIALITTSALSLIFLTATIVEHYQIADLSSRCSAYQKSNAAAVKSMMNLLDSSKPGSDAKKIRF